MEAGRGGGDATDEKVFSSLFLVDGAIGFIEEVTGREGTGSDPGRSTGTVRLEDITGVTSEREAESASSSTVEDTTGSFVITINDCAVVLDGEGGNAALTGGEEITDTGIVNDETRERS